MDGTVAEFFLKNCKVKKVYDITTMEYFMQMYQVNIYIYINIL